MKLYCLVILHYIRGSSWCSLEISVTNCLFQIYLYLCLAYRSSIIDTMFYGQYPVLTKIVLINNNVEQGRHFSFLENCISYHLERDIGNMLYKCRSSGGKLSQSFKLLYEERQRRIFIKWWLFLCCCVDKWSGKQQQGRRVKYSIWNEISVVRWIHKAWPSIKPSHELSVRI